MQTINAVCIDFLESTERAAKETTTQSHSNFGMANLFDLLLKVTSLKRFKVWTQHRSKGKPLNQTNGHLDVDYTHQSQSLGTSPEKSNFTLHKVSL